MSTLPATVEAVHALSPTQRGLLFHSLYAPASGVYGVQLVFDLHGVLDEAAFAQAWQALVQQHAMLRTAFAWEKMDSPLQVVGRQARLPLQHEDGRGLTSPQQVERWNELLAADRQRGFELQRAPLARVQVLRLAEAHHRVLFSHHHLLLDGWSLPLLLRDWRLAYTAAVAGAVPRLPPAAPFHEHLAWLAAQDSAAARQAWQALLAGFDEPSTPDFAHPATTVGSDAGATPGTPPGTPHRLGLVLDAAPVQALARQCRVTVGTLLQAAWALLLARHVDRDDVVYGLTRAGRPASRPQAAGSVGPFLTTLPVRTRLPEALPLGRWLQQLQAAVQAQAPHEHLAPAEVQRCASALAPGRALFDSVVVIENYPGGPADDNAPLRVDAVQVHESTHYPLSLYAVLGDPIELRLLADPARVALADAQACLARLQHLLQALLAPGAATQPLGRLGLMAAEAAAAAVVRGPSPPGPDPQGPWTPQHIAHWAAADLDAPALHDAAGTVSRGELQALAQGITAQLNAQGVRAGDRVGVCLARGRDMLAALLAVWRLGAAYVPMDATYPAARLRHMAHDAGLATLLLHGATRGALDWYTGPRTDLDDASPSVAAGAAAGPAEIAAAPLHADSPAYLIYTSGSTGTPKGVPIGHGSLLNLLQAMATRLALQPVDRWLAVTTLSFDIAALELFGPLLAGASVVLASEDDARQPERLLALLRDPAVTVMQATPSTWRLLLASGWQGRAGQRLLCGGEALDPALGLALLGDAGHGPVLWNVYGPTETTIWSAALPLSPALLQGAGTPVGGALDHTTLQVLDRAGRPLPPGVPGELCIGGTGLSPGYHRRPALTADRFVPGPDGALLYRSGDRVRQRDDGLFDFLGRLDQQTKLRGHRLELGEVEAALAALPGVAQAVAVIEGQGADARLVAYVTAAAVDAAAGEASTNAAAALTHTALRAQLAQQLPAWMLPTALHTLPGLPLTPNGKIDRQALPAAAALAAPLADSRTNQPPASALEQQLLALWRDLLQQPGLGLHQHFFEAGGHSLLLLSLQNRLRQQLGRELPLVELFNHPTVASLAAHLQAQDDGHAQAAAAAEAHSRAAGRERLLQRRQRAGAAAPASAESQP